jgi:HK97 family phage major capsid protein
MKGPEQRTIDVDVNQLDTRGRKVTGYACVYNTLSEDLGGFREKIAPGAFASVLPSADVRCLLNHDANKVLGRTRSGTLRLRDEDRGLHFECDLPESPIGEDVREAVRRGDVDGASFRFVVDTESWEDGDIRTINKVKDLSDVTIATYGAYPDASVELRTRTPNRNEGKMECERLTVEDRSAAPPSMEQRVTDALLSVPRGEARALSNATVGDGISPPELSSFVFDKLRASSVALRAGIRVIPTDRETIVWPQLTGDVDPKFYSEAETFTPGDPTFTTVTGTPRKLGALVQFSNEVLDDSEPSIAAIVHTNLLQTLALKLDAAILEGNGTPPAIRGLKNVAGIQSVSMGTDGAQLASLDPFVDAIALLEAENVPGPYAILANPRTWKTVRKLKDDQHRPLLGDSFSTDSPMSVYGVPVFLTNQLSVAETQGSANTGSSAYVFAPAEVALVSRQDAVAELDRSRLFNSDQSEMRAKLRADLIVPHPKAVVRIAGILP